VGVPLLPFAAALAAEVVIGALLWVGVALLRERHEQKQNAPETPDPSERTDTTGTTDATDDGSTSGVAPPTSTGDTVGSQAGSARDDPEPATVGESTT